MILKTTYLDSRDQWDGVYWPSLQVQSHIRSRCLYPATGTATLWNTGRTALEMLPPRKLAEVLKELSRALGDNTHRVIVSLGSKFPPSRRIEAGV